MSLNKLFKLKNQLRLYFMISLVFLALLIIIPTGFIGKEERVKESQREMDKMLNLQQVFIDHWFEENLADISSIANLPLVKNEDYDEIEIVFKKFKENYSKFDSIVYANAEGVTEVSDSGRSHVDLTGREYYHQTRKGKAYVSEVLTGKKTNESIIIIAVPVYNYEDDFQGLVFGSIHLDTIQEVMAQFQDDSGETYLIDTNGQLITESKQDMVGERIDTPIYQAAMDGEELNGFYNTHNGNKVLGKYRWVNDGNWLIIGEVEEAEIYQPLRRLIQVFLLEFIVLMGLGLVMIIWFSKRIESPIYSVLEGTRRIGQGEWGYRLTKTNWKVDEFEELNKNFNEMASLIEGHMMSIAKSEERFRMIAQYSSDMISVHDAKGNFLYVSPAGKEILNYEDEEVIGHHVFDFIHEDDIDVIQKDYEVLLKKGHIVATYRVLRKDGNYIWFESSLRRLRVDHSEDSKIYIVSRNITERKNIEKKLKEANALLQELSTKDGLTNAWNRRSFDEQLQKEWNLSLIEQTPLSLIMFDVDYFKKFNDTYGHQTGDDCLKRIVAVAHRVEEALGYKVFRYGGEEFCLLLPGATAEEAEEVARSIGEAVEGLKMPHEQSEVSKYVTISCGTNTQIATTSILITQFIENADQALYEAKKAGRNCVRSYE